MGSVARRSASSGSMELSSVAYSAPRSISDRTGGSREATPSRSARQVHVLTPPPMSSRDARSPSAGRHRGAPGRSQLSTCRSNLSRLAWTEVEEVAVPRVAAYRYPRSDRGTVTPEGGEPYGGTWMGPGWTGLPSLELCSLGSSDLEAWTYAKADSTVRGIRWGRVRGFLRWARKSATGLDAGCSGRRLHPAEVGRRIRRRCVE